MIYSGLSFEKFKEYDFVFYEQFLFRNLLSIYNDQKIKYKLLAINVFKERKNAPVLIDLNSMNEDLLFDFYTEIYLKEKSDYISAFDYMGLMQNLIKTNLEFEDFAENLTQLMVINQNQLFRFYDPRVLIHVFLLGYRNKTFVDNTLKEWIPNFQKIFDEWCISLWGNNIIFNRNDFTKFDDPHICTTITIKDFEVVNKQVKEKMNINKTFSIHEIVEIMQALHIQLEKDYVA